MKLVPFAVTSSDKYAPYLPLQKAMRNGDLEVVKSYIDSNPSALTAAFLEFGTALHVAEMTEHVNIMEELVNRMIRPEYFKIIGDYYGESVISLTAAGGILKIAELVLTKNTSMLARVNKWGNVPVVVAGIHGHDDMTRYLYSLTPPEVLNPVRGKLGVRLAIVCIIADVYGKMKPKDVG